MSQDKADPKPKKLSKRQIDALISGMGPEAQALFLKSLEAQDMMPGDKGPGTGVSREDKEEIFRRVVGRAGTEPKEVNVTDLIDAGFPDSVAAAPYWAGMADGAEVAYSCGWKSSLRFKRNESKGKPGSSFTLYLKLTPLTDKNRLAREKMLSKKNKDKVSPKADDAHTEE